VIWLSIWSVAAFPGYVQAAPAPQGETFVACLPEPPAADCSFEVSSVPATDENIDKAEN
jgi:hypothetical protein